MRRWRAGDCRHPLPYRMCALALISTRLRFRREPDAWRHPQRPADKLLAPVAGIYRRFKEVYPGSSAACTRLQSRVVQGSSELCTEAPPDRERPMRLVSMGTVIRHPSFRARPTGESPDEHRFSNTWPSIASKTAFVSRRRPRPTRGTSSCVSRVELERVVMIMGPAGRPCPHVAFESGLLTAFRPSTRPPRRPQKTLKSRMFQRSVRDVHLRAVIEHGSDTCMTHEVGCPGHCDHLSSCTAVGPAACVYLSGIRPPYRPVSVMIRAHRRTAPCPPGAALAPGRCCLQTRPLEGSHRQPIVNECMIFFSSSCSLGLGRPMLSPVGR